MVHSRCPKFVVRVVVLLALTASYLALGPTPAGAAPSIVTFTASLQTAPDTVRLTWTSTGATKAFIWGAVAPGNVFDIGQRPVNGFVDVPNGPWGRNFTLGVVDGSGVWRYKTIDTTALGITPPAPVTITSTSPKVIDYFRSPNINSSLPSHTLTWNTNGASVVTMRRCANGTCADLGGVTSPYTITGDSLAVANGDGSFSGLLAPSGQGEVMYELTSCTLRQDTSRYCGEPVIAPVRVLPSQLTSTFREYRNDTVSGKTISWSANGGNWFYLDAPTLGLNNVVTASTSYTFTPAQLNDAGPGLHTIKLKACKWYGGATFDCAFQHVVKASVAGTVADLAPLGKDIWPAVNWFATNVATVGGQPHYTLRGGNVVLSCGCQNQNVAAGTALATIETYDVSVTQLQNGGGQTWTTKPWTQDFNQAQSTYISGQDLAAGVNGTTILGNGDIYALSEYGGGPVTTSGTVTKTHARPLLFKPAPHPMDPTNPNLMYFEPVRPYSTHLTGVAAPAATSSSQDSFKDASGKVWSSEGWAGEDVREVQVVTVDATSGQWKLTFAGQVTANIDSEASAATVQARLEALSNIEVGEVTVAGAAGGPYTATFQKRLAANVPQMTAQSVSLAGGGASVGVTTTSDGVANHSRIYRFDPAAVDSDQTLQDDAICSYNVPGNNNDVIGVTNGGGQTWFIESLTRRLTWFNPSEAAFSNCAAQNTLDYGSAQVPIADPPGPAVSPGYCPTLASTGCFKYVDLPPELGTAGHLVYDNDPVKPSIWTSTYTFGNKASLGRYDITTSTWEVFPLPTPVSYLPPWNLHLLNGGSTWKISLAGNYLYINDHTDGDIIRFDKAATRSNCMALRNEVQWVTPDATAGNWTLSFLGQTTANIDSEASALTVKTALEALPNIDVGEVTVAGSAGGRYDISFQGSRYGAKDVAQLRATNVSLTGGAAKVTVSTPQQGGENLCMSEVHLPSFWAWQSIAKGTKLYWTATGPMGGGVSNGIGTQPYVNDSSKFGYIDLNSWGAITTYTGLETLVAPSRAGVGDSTYSWFDIDQASGKIAIGQRQRKQFIRLVP